MRNSVNMSPGSSSLKAKSASVKTYSVSSVVSREKLVEVGASATATTFTVTVVVSVPPAPSEIE